MKDFDRIAIVNRGEAAMRLIHAARELGAEQGERRLSTVALYTDPDARAMFVREADFSVHLGPATFVDPRDGRRKSTYLDYARLERALVESKADAAWVGWGFVSEHAEFAELCARLGITFIGPSPEVMRKLADKITAKRLAEQAGLPVSPWSGGPLATLAEAREKAEALGYPLMLKASAGGGGRGIRAIASEAELCAAFDRARAEALAAFGDATVFLERRVQAARHIEVQMIGDHHGNAWAVGVRDCTIQRRHQKVMEEAPSPVLSPDQDRELRASAARLAKIVGYQNAGTVEFLYDPASRGFAFMEVNARLQVEHPVTEETTGLDLVKLQIHVARGGHLQGEPPPAVGHAIEVRLCAEDPENDFTPAPGRIEMLRLPTGPGLRVDRGVTEGDAVPPEFDSMIAKLIAWGRDRDEALARLRRALTEAAIAIRGGSSNKALLLDLVCRPEVRASAVDTAWLDALAARGEHVSRAHADAALLVAAAEAYQAEQSVERAQFYASAARGRPKVRSEVGRVVELRHGGRDYRLDVMELSPLEYRVASPGGAARVKLDRLGPFERRLRYAGRGYRVLVVEQDTSYFIEVEGVPHRVHRDAGGIVRAPTPAMVLSIAVHPSDAVLAGDRLATLEAMKMEMAVTAPFAGRVREVLVTANVQVDAGAPLMRLEPIGVTHAEEKEEPLRFAAAPAAAEDGARARWTRAHEELRRLLLGFDMDAAYAKRFVPEWERCSAALPPDDPALRRAEEDALTIFADLHALFRQKPADDDGPAFRSPREYLLTYLRALDLRGEGLPGGFLAQLGLALAHYGVDGLDRTPALEDALIRISKAHDRGALQAAAVATILERWLVSLSPHDGGADDRLRVLLERLIAVTQGRFPTVSDLAREVRYRVFEQAGFDRARDAAYAQVDAALARLAAGAEGDERDGHIATLIDCPQPLVRALLDRFVPAAPAMRALMLEVLIRRYYRIRRLDPIVGHAAGDRGVVTSAYDHEGRRVHVFATHAVLSDLTAAVSSLAGLVAEVPADHDVVLDVYACSSEVIAGAEALSAAVQAALGAAEIPRPLRRVVVIAVDPTTMLRAAEPTSVRRPAASSGSSRAKYLTFRPAKAAGGPAYEEDKVYRGLHPMMGKRMQLWRFANFDIERLPSAEDVFLFHAQGRDNPKDERLFAVAEIRDFTPVRDASSRVVSLPYLERMLLEALASIRLAQARRPPHERLQWNRVLLYAWQPLHLSPRELVALVRRLAPATEGLGMEQVLVHARVRDRSTGELREQVLRITATVGRGLRISLSAPSETPLRIMSEYELRVTALRRRGLVYPYEIIRLLTPDQASGSPADFPPGEFVEHDLDGDGKLVPVDRPRGKNKAHVVVGVIKNVTRLHPEGLTRVVILGDPSKEMGSVAEPECSRVNAALDLAERMGVPVDWFTLSAGAKISMTSGTENMDWISATLRRIIEFTQAGHEINVVVCGVNVGAQPYWNAEATMLMHTKGILVMTPDVAMVLTGKQALDYSGSVSAEDNQGIGGYDRIMGPNGQAQYLAEDIASACRILLAHHEYTFRAPGERFPRRAPTTDPVERDVRSSPHPGGDFATVGEVFSDEKNHGKKRPFDVRAVMSAVVDGDHPPLERWKDMADAEIAVVWDARIGGHAVCLIGIESRPLRRIGFIPADGPEQWTAGTLFPRSSKKVARSINAASDNRPLVVLANLSGFDGSPESMRSLQLEYGAEIGRAIVNFKGPIVFCVISRYHGGAFVVFSKRLNPAMETSALEGAYASVIGGAPAAAAVFARDVDTRAAKDARVVEIDALLARASGDEKRRLAARRAEVYALVRSEKLGEVAEEFDRVHSVQRAREVGSLDLILPPARLRPYLVDAIERGMAKALAT